ncbi:MAG: DnaJ C-terminal domain-containing protein [Vulcanimicrobiota bacterium]
MSEISYKDYYKILGVGKGASEKEIKSAYRKLARQYHPDVNPGDKSAEERFQDINEAYEVLKDTEKRQQYDRFGSQWKQASAAGGRGPGPGQHGFDFDFSGFGFGGGGGGGGFSDFVEQMFGGAGRRGAPRAAQGANARADIEVSLEEAFSGAVRSLTLTQQKQCPNCGGVGVTSSGVCAACNGQGQQRKERRLEVKIPAGVTDGSKIRVRGEGEPGRGGGKPGDLFLTVKLAKHPVFEVKGHDLYCEQTVSVYDAVLGGETSLKTLKGEVNLKIPAGSQGGAKMRLKGLGLPRSGGKAVGDLYVVLRLKVPTELSERQRALYEELAALERQA